MVSRKKTATIKISKQEKKAFAICQKLSVQHDAFHEEMQQLQEQMQRCRQHYVDSMQEQLQQLMLAVDRPPEEAMSWNISAQFEEHDLYFLWRQVDEDPMSSLLERFTAPGKAN